MKQVIVMMATILLGIFIFGLIMNPEGSLFSATQGVWKQEIQYKEYQP